jgi:membrane associated rhomboid family serine protease
MFFFLLPVGVDYRARRYPVVTFTLMGICVLVYLVTLALELSNGSAVEVWVTGNLWLTPAESHWWNYLTSQFVHEGFFHLAGNMVYLFLFGACVEDLIGRTRFTLFYLLSGVAAVFAHIAVSPNHFASEIPLGGASGAISGCIGAFLLLLARTKIEFKWFFFFFFRVWTGAFFLPAWVVISFWFLEDFVSMVLTAIASTEGGGVAFAAHVGGTLFGIALMSLEKLRRKHLPESPEEAEETVETAARPVARIRVRPAVAPAVVETPTIYIFAEGSQSGPFTLGQVQQMFAHHALPTEALYWQPGMEAWRSAEELREPGVG